MLELTLATFNAGRPDETVNWAERVLDSHVEPGFAMTAHRLVARDGQPRTF